MNWGEIPQEMLDASAQLQKAQENITKMVNDEINRRCYAWRMKVETLLREREALRAGLQSAEGFFNCPQEIKSALAVMRANDVLWFPQTTPADHIRKLENP